MSLVCTELRLRNYRNFEELRLELPPTGAVIIGDNGSGKTNLVEALYYLEIFRSFRGAADEQLVRFGTDAFFVRGVFQDAMEGTPPRRFEVSAAYEPRARTKRVSLDGVEPDRIGDALGQLGAVVFSPSDVDIVAGGPGERRRFLDIVLSLNAPGYLDALQRYRHLLRHRNAMLRAGSDDTVIEAFDDQMIAHGTRLMVERGAWVAGHAARFAELYRDISGGRSATLGYAPDVGVEDGGSGAIAAAFRARLQRVARRERERGVTLAGPHRDDVALVLETESGGVDLRQYGSGGQLRTGAVALRLVESDTILAARGRRPLMLLDDVFAELDPGRSRRIVRLLEEGAHGQVVLTAPKETDVMLGPLTDGAAGRVARWRIRDGRVSGAAAS
ncbi:MAG TPA: DNA replication and repair protein RecF [Longimicrobiales bacterium]|nr:DNA replication and repair protein RecF [Longimicrobiales bacterium]